MPALQRRARTAADQAGRPIGSFTRWEERVARGALLRFAWSRRHDIVLAATVIAFVGAWLNLHRFQEARALRPAVERPAVGGTGQFGTRLLVGAPLGSDVRQYLTARRHALEGVPEQEQRAAVVSLKRYTAGADALAQLPDDLVPVRFQLRVPTEGQRPFEVVAPAGGNREQAAAVVEAAVRKQREIIESELGELEQLLQTPITDSGFIDFYRKQAESLRKARDLLVPGAPVVFAVVVRGPAGQLQSLSRQRDVRLVDPAPDSDATAGRFFGLLPDDTDKSNYGPA